MISIVTSSLVMLAGLIAFSQYLTFAKDAETETARFRYMIFAFSITASAIFEVSMSLAYGSSICFILYGLDRLTKVLFMCEIVLLTKDMVEVSSKYISAFISLISYSAIALFFADSLLPGGALSKSRFGVCFVPHYSWHQALYFVYYMFFLIILCAFAVYKSAVSIKKREKDDLRLLFLMYFFGAFGFISEQFIIAYSVEYVPLPIFTTLISAIFMRKLLVYHESIVVKESRFRRELDPGRTDVVFVMDEKFNIIYENKRAQVLEALNHDVFMGRKLTEVYKFNNASYNQLLAKPDESAFGLSADYEPTDRHVNMIINHKVDKYGEILASVVFVYNMEEFEKSQNHVLEMNEKQEESMIENALSITKDGSVLIVDEDVLFLNVFQRILKPYGLFVTRVFDGKEAIEQVKNHVFDIIFIAYEMDKLSGADTVRHIRSLAVDYARNVPIVFLTNSNINDVFTEFLEVGFSDYLSKPISRPALNSVLTRWLWQRIDETEGETVAANPLSSQYQELSDLLIDAENMYGQSKFEMLRYLLNGIKRNSKILGLEAISELASDLDEAIEFGDNEKISQLFEKMRAGIRDAITL